MPEHSTLNRAQWIEALREPTKNGGMLYPVSKIFRLKLCARYYVVLAPSQGANTPRQSRRRELISHL